jgi:ParB-like chromosome segregation protein Spo0J
MNYRIERMEVARLMARPGMNRDRTMRQGLLFALGASLRDLGELGPVAVVNERTGTIIDGRERLRRLEEAGVKSCTVAVVQLTLAQERAARVQLNSGGQWEPEALEETLRAIAAADPDLYERQRLDETMIDLLGEGIGTVPGPQFGQMDLYP